MTFKQVVKIFVNYQLLLKLNFCWGFVSYYRFPAPKVPTVELDGVASEDALEYLRLAPKQLLLLL